MRHRAVFKPRFQSVDYCRMDLVAAIRTPSCLWISWSAVSAGFRPLVRSDPAATAPSRAWWPRWSCPRCSRQAASCSRSTGRRSAQGRDSASRSADALSQKLNFRYFVQGCPWSSFALASTTVLPPRNLDLLFGKCVVFPFFDGTDAAVLVRPTSGCGVALPVAFVPLVLLRCRTGHCFCPRLLSASRCA